MSGAQVCVQIASMRLTTFPRRFRTTTGPSPGEWLASARVPRAREMLERSAIPVAEIATLCGFGSSETPRHRFRRRLSLTPARYRKLFGSR